MSQVIFWSSYKSAEVQVMGGWDHIVEEFFLTILDGKDEPVWTSIYDYSPEDQDSAYRLKLKLVELGIQPPQDFWNIVEEQDGNVVWKHDPAKPDDCWTLC